MEGNTSSGGGQQQQETYLKRTVRKALSEEVTQKWVGLGRGGARGEEHSRHWHYKFRGP